MRQRKHHYSLAGMMLLVFYSANLSSQGAVTHPQLRQELLQMERQDQRYRLPGNPDPDLAMEINQTHVSRLKEMLNAHGWPTISMPTSWARRKKPTPGR